VTVQPEPINVPSVAAESWQHEIARAYTRPEQLASILGLNKDWLESQTRATTLFPMRIPRPFVALMQYGDPNDPLLLQVLPNQVEFQEQPDFTADPLLEQNLAGPAGLLHKYKSRVLILLKGGCAVNCRYCFRRHFPYQEHRITQHQWQEIDRYIGDHKELNEVILSGGDPLMAKDRHLSDLVTLLESHPHIKRLRIHTRLPVVIPTRITETLTATLARSRLQSIMVLHINHPNEISTELGTRVAALKQAGVLVLNQSVLMASINDNSDTLKALSETLFDNHILPYYLHQMDKVAGASHFYVPEARAKELMQTLLRELPGFLVPKFVKEIGGEASKTPIHY